MEIQTKLSITEYINGCQQYNKSCLQIKYIPKNHSLNSKNISWPNHKVVNETRPKVYRLRYPNALTYYNLFFLSHLKLNLLSLTACRAVHGAYHFHILMPFYTILMLYYFHTLMPFPYTDTFSIAWHYFNTLTLLLDFGRMSKSGSMKNAHNFGKICLEDTSS